MKIIDVAVGQAIDRLSYRAPETSACLAHWFQVPLGKKKKQLVALYWDQLLIHWLRKLKDIVAIYPHPLLPYEEILLLDWLSYYYLSDIGLFVRIMLRGHRDFLKAKPATTDCLWVSFVPRHSSQREAGLESIALNLSGQCVLWRKELMCQKA